MVKVQHCRKSVQDSPQVTYESVEDVHLTDPNSVYFNVGLESESETSEVLSLPGSSEEVTKLGPKAVSIQHDLLGSSLVVPNCDH